MGPGRGPDGLARAPVAGVALGELPEEPRARLELAPGVGQRRPLEEGFGADARAEGLVGELLVEGQGAIECRGAAVAGLESGEAQPRIGGQFMARLRLAQPAVMRPGACRVAGLLARLAGMVGGRGAQIGVGRRPRQRFEQLGGDGGVAHLQHDEAAHQHRAVAERTPRLFGRQAAVAGLGLGRTLELPLALAQPEENLVQGRRRRMALGQGAVFRQRERVEPAAEETVRQELAVVRRERVDRVRRARRGPRAACGQQERQDPRGQPPPPRGRVPPPRLEGFAHRAPPPFSAPGAAAVSSPRVAKEMFQMSAWRQRSMTPRTSA